MKTVFVDTAALIALGNKQDSFHIMASQNIVVEKYLEQ